MRSVVALSVKGERLVGTVHHPAAGLRSDVGVLIFNFGQAPRAGLGDLAAHMGDSLGNRGYSVFRFDLPGLGDSGGELPERIQGFWRMVQDGGHIAQACHLVSALIERFHLRSMVVGGLCGGAITAIYAANKLSSQISGVVAIEPDFILTPLPQEEEAQGQTLSTDVYLASVAANKRNLLSLSSWKRFLSGQSAYGHHVHLVRHSVRMWWERVNGHALPADANLPLIECTRRLGRSQVPMLIVNAGEAARDFMERDILGPHRQKVSYVTISGTNHLFIAGTGKQELIANVESWMLNTFPPRGSVGPEQGQGPPPSRKVA
jgi:pimeloyl-ACP methyl ester carboxylesterase